MGMLIVSIFVIVSISLLEFIDRSEWEELEEKNALRLTKNRAYGAFKIRSQQSLILVGIVAIVAVLIVLYITVDRIGFGGSENTSKMIEKASEYKDTAQFALNLDTSENTPPGAFNQSGNNGDNMPVAQKGAEKTSDHPERVVDRENTPKPEKQKKLTPEEEAKAFEESLFKNAPGYEARKKILEQAEKDKKEREERAKQKKIEGGTGGQSGTNSSPKGETQVTYYVEGRDALDHDDWNVRNPGYTCGSVNAKVVVAVKVNSNGNVISAVLKSNEGGNQCCIGQAIAYAKKSRFMYNSAAVQEGTITYRFKAQ